MAQIEVNDVRLSYEDYGTGPSVVLVHGLGSTGTDLWKKQIADLAEGFRVVAYDLRGSGRSDVTPGPYTIELLADDLHGLVVALGLAPAAIVGHSMGGSVALAEAAAHPDSVRAVVAVGGPTRLPDQGREGLAARADTVLAEGMNAVAETVATNGMAASFREGHPEEFQEYISLLGSANVDGYAAQCRALAAMDLSAALPRIAAPALLVCGEHDKVAPPATVREQAAAIPEAAVVEIAECGHIIPWEKPQELRTAVWPFLLESR